jgi:hypothetical protein
MIAGAALAAWLADPEAQRRSYQGVEDYVQRWSGHPLMTDTERALVTLEDRTPEAVLGVARAFLDRTGDLDALMGELLSSSAADPFFRPPFQPMSSDIHNAFLLYHHPDLSIGLGVSGVDMLAAKKTGPRGATSIGFNGVTTLFRYLRAGGATISFWEAPPITDMFDASRAGTARRVDRRRIEDGEEIVIDGRYQSFVIDHAVSDVIFFQALVRVDAAPVSAEYDSKTLSLIGASSTDEASSRVQMMVSLLRTMEREDAVPWIIEALGSPHFYTRWHIMRELLALDADAALPHLRRMAEDDPHPEVRAAAGQTLQLFFADAPAAAGDVQCRA